MTSRIYDDMVAGLDSITHYMQARHELNGRLTEMINLTQQLPWPRTLFLLLPLGFLPSFLLFLEARYTTVTLNVSWCNHTVVRRNGVWQNIVHVQKTYVHKPCIFCGHIWKGATYSIWEVHFNLFVIESHYTLVHRVESVENYALCMRWCLLWRRMLARILDVSMWTVTSNCATKFTLASCTLHDIIK